MTAFIPAEWLPTLFVGLMGLAVLMYAVLDGYDLGVGILLPLSPAAERQRDTMIASIGPFWDANETWLVLAVGLLLIAFPAAHSYILTQMYLPVSIMLLGLILRGVAFDFRAKAAIDHKATWDRIFRAGSLLTTLAQGYMLGHYVMGFEPGWHSHWFGTLSAVGVTTAYCYIGAAWLVMKTDGELQRHAVKWTAWSGRAAFGGVLAVSVINPLVNPGVFDRWFTYPLVMFVLLIPALCFLAFIANELLVRRLPKPGDRHCWLPFANVVVIFILCFTGLAFSFYPEIVPGKIHIRDAASADASLRFILVGALVVVPLILAYTAFAYRVFHGKATTLRYH